MIDLFVDSSLSYIRLILFKDNIVLDSINERADKDLSRLFCLRVKEIFNRNNLDFNDINKIYCVTGPGSFTGIRIGLTFVKVLAFSLNKKVIPISELQVLASTSCDGKYIVPLIDARRGFVFAGVYNKNLDNILFDSYISIEDLMSKVDVSDVSFVSYDSFLFNTLKPNIDFKRVYLKNKDCDPIDCHFLVPNYLKRTEAEEKSDNI